MFYNVTTDLVEPIQAKTEDHVFTSFVFIKLLLKMDNSSTGD